MTAGPGPNAPPGHPPARRGSARAQVRAAAGTSAAFRLAPPSGRQAGDEGARWGLVLGGGGVLGAAWLVGALEALEEIRGVDARDAELIVGTSAGSIVGSLLAAGVSVADLRSQQLGERRPEGPAARSGLEDDRPAGGAYPPRPKLAPGNARIITRNARRLRRMPPTAVLSGLLPTGRGRMPGVGRLIEQVAPDGAWSTNPGLRVVALDYDGGRRVAFGAEGAPAAGLTEAVLASCAIPGWFAPVDIGGVRYVDGGVWSATNIDLAAGAGLDEVIALAPMASWQYDRPRDWRVRLERRWRTRITRRALSEARRVHRDGAGVTVLGPGPDDLTLIGFNVMAPGRRREVLETSRRTSLTALASPLDAADERQRDTAEAVAASGVPAGDAPDPADLDTPMLDLDAVGRDVAATPPGPDGEPRRLDLDAVETAGPDAEADLPGVPEQGERA